MKNKISMLAIILLAMFLFDKPARATEPGGGGGGTGQNKELVFKTSYHPCPGGQWITVEGKCCDPGQGGCLYVSCTNYQEPVVNCPPQ